MNVVLEPSTRIRSDNELPPYPAEDPVVDVQTLRLLYAEDDPDDIILCMNQLEEAGIEVNADIAASKESFIKALQSNDYDIVLTDYRLPGWSGIEVLGILKEDERDIPCIMVTGSVAEGIAVACIKQGATDYILKDRPARLPLAIKRALEERKERETRKGAERIRNRLASIVESSLDAIVSADEEGAIVNWNPGAETMFGYSAEEVKGRQLSSLFISENSEAAPGKGATAGKGEAIERYETQGIRKDGSLIDLAVTLSPVQDSDGTPAGSSAIIRDITEAKQMQKEFLTTQKLEAIGQLAGGVAHDFNNLLTVINGYARMLQRKGGIPDPEQLNAILQAGERGQRLTKQLLGFSRKQITQFKPVNLNWLVLGFLDMLRPLIGADVELRTVLAQDISQVRADSGQLEQVIMNLVVNARDAMPEGGVITIQTKNLSAEETGKESAVTLSVTDSGTGMTPEVQARIFEPFFTTKEVGRGTGLGLSTTAVIVNHCQGELKVASELGRGTTFTIQLPAYAEREDRAAAENDVTLLPSMPLGSGTILVAEDDPTVRGFVLAVLQDQGYRVLCAENGRKALELSMQHDGVIDVLVTDVVMPEMNGRELAERARLTRPNLKVLFVSGYVNKGLKDEDILNPSYKFLEKPFTGETLNHMVSRFCKPATLPAALNTPN